MQKGLILIVISEQLKKFRKLANLSRSQVAEKIGCTTSAICYWESGKRQPDADTLIQLIHLYNVHISQFFDENPCENITDLELKLITQYRNAPQECKAVIETILQSYERQ